MYVTRLATEGLRHAPPELVELDRVVQLPDPPGRRAVADALVLFAAGLRPGPCLPLLRGLGWGGTVHPGTDDDDDTQFRDLDAAAVRSMVEDDTRAVTVDARLSLDPPLYGRLRSQAMRDPRVVTALGQEATLSLKVGWLFNGDRSAVVPSLLGVRIGDVPFEASGPDRPTWLPGLVRDLAGRFRLTDPYEPLAELQHALRTALLSPEPTIRTGFEAWGDTLEAAPFSLPRPTVVEVGGRAQLVFGPHLLRARQLGRDAIDISRVVYAAMVERPDVLVVAETTPPSLAEWLRALPEAEDAPIEQIWMTE